MPKSYTYKASNEATTITDGDKYTPGKLTTFFNKLKEVEPNAVIHTLRAKLRESNEFEYLGFKISRKSQSQPIRRFVIETGKETIYNSLDHAVKETGNVRHTIIMRIARGGIAGKNGDFIETWEYVKEEDEN